MAQTPNTTELAGSTSADRLASMAHDTIDRVTPRAKRVEVDMRTAAAETVEGAKQLHEQAVQATEESLRKVHAYIAKNPLTTVGIALAIGALLGALIRR